MRRTRLDELMYLVGVGGAVMATIAFFNGNRIVLGIGCLAGIGFLTYLFFREVKREKRRAEKLKQ